MNQLKIEPLGNIVHLKIEEAKAGILDTSSRMTAVEVAEVVAVGPDVKSDLKQGDKVFVKAWGIDLINHEDKRYFFVAEDTNAILAKIK